MQLIDAHVHFDDPRLDADRAAVYARAREAGIEAMVVPAVSAASWPRLQAVATEYPGVFPAYGLHPYFLGEHRPDDLEDLRKQLQGTPAVAVGECGLDFFRDDLDTGLQQDYFRAQLDLARELDLPIIIHARRAVDAVLKQIRVSGHHLGMVHSFSGSAQQASQLIDLGYRLGFGGAITHARATRLRRLIPALPLDALLLETDAPDQPPAGHRGGRNEPAWLTGVLQAMAGIRGIPVETIAAATSANAIALFDLPLKAVTATTAPAAGRRSRKPQSPTGRTPPCD